MPFITVGPDDRVHFLIWRAHPSAQGDPGWRLAQARNGVPITFGSRFSTWREAWDTAIEHVE